MGTALSRTMGGVGAMAMSALLFGSAQLHLDGILIVNGLPLEGSRVIMIAKDGEAQVLTEGLSHFTLRLDLQKDYLVSFERPGCVSKQLRFNTNVPAENLSPDGFRFPFQVTLEPAPEGQRMEYAGPVGYIHFDGKLNDFSYSTDYRMLKDDFLAKELELIQTKLMSEVPSASPVAPHPAHDAGLTASMRKPVMAEAIKPVRAQDMVAPVVSRTPPMVHVLATATAPSPVSLNDIEPGTPHTAHPLSLALSEPARTEAVVMKRLAEPLDVEAVPVVEKEVQVDSLRVTTIIRLHRGMTTDEYRRVVSYYGGTTYFCNGYACSADTFQRGVNR